MEAMNNGHGDAIVAALREQIAQRKQAAVELQAQLDAITPELRRYERALAVLTSDPPATPRRGRPRRDPDKPVRSTPSRVGPERLAMIEEAIREFAADHDEFRQVDIRGIRPDINSGMAATGFEALRQQGVIRIARQDGNSKWYRLTREALRNGVE